MAPYRGLTWDHPRGRDALVAAGGELDLVWDVHPLSGFESTPIEELAERYDVIVLDHPHLGDALAHRCLQPVDDFLDGPTEFAGPSLASYRMDGRLWALPLDAATQVAATRADLVEPPQLWSEVVELSHSAPVALSVAGPHALLTFASICVALGEAPAAANRFVSPTTGVQALEVMTDLIARAPRHTVSLDPIGLLTDMTSDDTVAHCPLVYGYVNYAAVDLPRRLTFTDAPSQRRGSRPGSTIGGTGLAVSARCEIGPDLAGHLRWLLSATAQESFIPGHSGQPARLSAWTAPAVNAPVGNFYLATLCTIAAAWIRPRYAGYIGFQSAASEVVREVLAGAVSIGAGLDRIDTLHSTSRQAAERIPS
jgi:multiple sugar transport system substrate-binding protein